MGDNGWEAENEKKPREHHVQKGVFQTISMLILPQR